MDLQIEKVDYYLDGGGTISYIYSPGSSVLNLIEDVVRQYAFLCPYRGPNEILIRQPLMWQLKKELLAMRLPMNGGMNTGMSELRVFGIKIVPIANLSWPIFYGDHYEYVNNDFNKLLEEALS